MARSVGSRSIAPVATRSASLTGLLLADMVCVHVIGHVRGGIVERLQSIIMRFFGRMVVMMMLGLLGLIDTRPWVNHDIVIGVRGLLSDTLDVALLILELDSAVLHISSVLDVDEADRANTLVELVFLSRLIAACAHHEIHSFVSADHVAT